MREILEYLIYDETLYLLNEENQRKITMSMEIENGWDIFVNADSVNPILSTDNLNEAIDCFNFTNY